MPQRRTQPVNGFVRSPVLGARAGARGGVASSGPMEPIVSDPQSSRRRTLPAVSVAALVAVTVVTLELAGDREAVGLRKAC
jgi:hypothetical protein